MQSILVSFVWQWHCDRDCKIKTKQIHCSVKKTFDWHNSTEHFNRAWRWDDGGGKEVASSNSYTETSVLTWTSYRRGEEENSLNTNPCLLGVYWKGSLENVLAVCGKVDRVERSVILFLTAQVTISRHHLSISLRLFDDAALIIDVTRDLAS